jgi:replicative DNA helicase
MDQDKSHNFLRRNGGSGNARNNPANRWFEAGGSSMGKLPPQAIELEEAVLGALMLEKDALNAVIDILKPDSFYKEAHQAIYRAVIALFGNSEPIDLLTVTQQLRQAGELELIGGAQYITTLTTKINSAANIESHARIVAEMAMKREMIRVASKILQDAFEDTTDVFTLLDTVEQSLFNISESNIRKNYADMTTIMTDALKELEIRRNQKDGLTGVPSGFSNLDRLTSGWQPTELVILAARPAMGKCLGKGTKVVMFDGTLKNVEDVQVGDWLMGDDSTPRQVRSLARGMENMYWVHQNRGISYRVNESHILSLKRSRNEGKHHKGDVINIGVKEYLNQSDKFRSNYKGYKVAIELAEKPVEIDPYFFGLWLGDGHSYSSRITTIDPEVIAYLDTYAHELNLSLVKYEQLHKTPNYGITSGQRGLRTEFCIQEELRELDTLGNKHIPDVYLYNSAVNRLKLLAGLIDSDGHYQADYDCYEITQKNEKLSRQIKYLADSLGFRASLNEKTATISEIGYESQVFRVRISGDLTKIPVKIERKKARPRKSKIDWRVTGIQVEFDCFDEYYGFEIDGNHLFLLEDMTVTHNTAFVVSSLRNAAVDFGMPVAIFSLEMSAVQLVNRMISAEAEIDSEKLKKGNLAPHEWTQLHQRIDRLMRAPIFIDDTPALSILELRAKCRRLKQQHDIKMVVIDYLQLMQGDTGGRGGGNREQEIASISRALKNLAKELHVPVIALSQLSRAVETRGGDKRPQLSDLRESGCVTGDTLITDARTGVRMTIKQLAERENPKAVLQCLGIDNQLKVKPRSMVNVFYSGRKQVYELRTRTGKTIKASANHPFLKLEGWARLDALKIGDKVAIPRQISISNPTNPLSDDELILLAHLLGDGCILPKQPYHYTSADEQNIKLVADTAQRLFGIEAKAVTQQNWQHLYLPAPYHLTHGKKHPITTWYERLGIERVRSYEKRLPEGVFECDNQKIALLLHHLWATDGNISWKKMSGRRDAAAIYYATSSPVLAEQVSHLLLRLGIRATTQTLSPQQNRPMYHIVVQGSEQQLSFLKLVGCFGERGRIIPELMAALLSIQPNPNTDIIPQEAWDLLIKPFKEEENLSWRAFSNKLNVAYSGSSLFKRGISRERMSKICQILPSAIALQHLAASDVFWDEIVSVTPLGVEDVYDATVADVHNFVANDFIIHNSIEQDADMVAFLYRPEYYGFTQDEAGNSIQGIGEVIVAKNRSGSLDTIQLRFIGKYTKFTDLDGYTGGGGGAPPAGNFTRLPSTSSSFETPPPPPAATGGTFKSRANDLGSMDFPPADPAEHPPF